MSADATGGGEVRGPWRSLRVRRAYENPWIAIDEHAVINPVGKPGIYGVVHFQNLAIGVLPLDDQGFTWLVGQYRFPLKAYSWELPEGGGAEGVDPQVSAARELKEETGLSAGQYRELCRLHLSNSATDELAIVYLAFDLSAGEAEPEETEALAVRRLPFAEVYRMVLRGEITDAMSVAAILRTRLLALEGGLPADLARRLRDDGR